MPRKKLPMQSKNRKKVSKKSAIARVDAPENLPLVLVPPKVFHFEHMFALTSAFIFVFATLLAISSASRAQEFRADITATVLPVESYSNYKFEQMNQFEKFWYKLTPYEKLMYQSGAGLTLVIIPLGLLLWKQQHQHNMTALNSAIQLKT